jgi:catechol 2,3-dioxygenase-like lactoylglutathione lyase family enzyme
MSHVRRFDHVGVTVADLTTVTTFFVGLGFEVEGTRTFIECEFLDTVIGIRGSRTEIVRLRPPDGGTRLELSSFVRPAHEPGSPAAMLPSRWTISALLSTRRKSRHHLDASGGRHQFTPLRWVSPAASSDGDPSAETSMAISVRD